MAPLGHVALSGRVARPINKETFVLGHGHRRGVPSFPRWTRGHVGVSEEAAAILCARGLRCLCDSDCVGDNRPPNSRDRYVNIVRIIVNEISVRSNE